MRSWLSISVLVLSVMAYAGSEFELNPQLSLIAPSTLVLSHEGEHYPYSSVTSIRTFQLGVGRSVWRNGVLNLTQSISLGYGSKDADTLFLAGNATQTGTFHLQWIPMSLSTRLDYAASKILKPSILMGAGMLWMGQRSDAHLYDHDFWIPHFFTSAGVTFLEASESKDWFGGFTCSVTFHSSLISEQILRGWSFDLGINVQL
jgi:hypothetical protein